MAGHSKWANIKNRKAAQDKKRSNIFTKLGKDITVAARSGGDPTMNFRLRLAMDKARRANMPNDNVERAIKRGTGEAGADIIEETTYEGFGPAGVACIVEATTDNKNRTAANVRTIFSKAGGSLGAMNSVGWMFEHVGMIRIEKKDNIDEESLFLELIEQGAQDVLPDENEILVITTITDFQKIQEYLDRVGYITTNAELAYVPNQPVEDVSPEDLEKINSFVDKLLDDDDVNNVFINVVA